MLNFYLHLATTGISDKLQLLFKGKSCMWLFRTNPSTSAQKSATFLLLTSATELSAFFFFPATWPFAEKIIILTNKKCTTNRIAYKSACKAALCYEFVSLLFTCSLLVLRCLPTSVTITLLCYVSRKNLSGKSPCIFTYLKTVLLTVGALIITERTWHTHQDFKLALQRNGACLWGKFTRSKKFKNFWVELDSFVRPLFSKKWIAEWMKRDTHFCLWQY